MQNFIGDLAILFIYMGSFGVLLAIGVFVADYVLPHIPFIQRYLDSLPNWEDE